MFMLRSRRTNLTSWLLKARKGRSSTNNTSNNVNNGNGGGTTVDDVRTLLKRLQVNQLEMLWQAVKGRGWDLTSNCVLVHRDADDDQPHVLCCQTWRWPELLHAGELRRLPQCRSACDPVYICCNPFHWSRIYQPETPPPPYTRCNSFKPEDRIPTLNGEGLHHRRDFPGSLTTDGEESRNSVEWCNLAYWELSTRVGPQYSVESPAVNIFGNVQFGDGLSLDTLAQRNCNAPESVINTRSKIGLGVTLSREDGYVWVYNRSEYPIFVTSLTLENIVDSPENLPLPTRVPAEQCLCVYDPIKAAHILNNFWTKTLSTSRFGPIDPNSIHISFAKGWGRNYSRRDITSCPCWIEIMLAPCR